ncbi:MAG: hypothetical protein LBP41_04435 [Holosporaceae bacterium]|jgi:hypothetical protein|nr:hypothetical protein [Holosporaceae bacterium]
MPFQTGKSQFRKEHKKFELDLSRMKFPLYKKAQFCIAWDKKRANKFFKKDDGCAACFLFARKYGIKEKGDAFKDWQQKRKLYPLLIKHSSPASISDAINNKIAQDSTFYLDLDIPQHIFVKNGTNGCKISETRCVGIKTDRRGKVDEIKPIVSEEII